jgi:hypothetical protein
LLRKKTIAPTESTVTTDKRKQFWPKLKNNKYYIEPLVASSGLSIQYAIMMGLIHDAVESPKQL